MNGPDNAALGGAVSELVGLRLYETALSGVRLA